MNLTKTLDNLFAELALVSENAPNERLPKEEQSRCILYAYLRRQFDVICVERGYRSIDEGHRHECDLLAMKSNNTPVWIEIKHCRCASGWKNKPSEELHNWKQDLGKLRRVPNTSDRYFLLICFADVDPCDKNEIEGRRVLTNIYSFHPEQCICERSRKFRWRKNDGIAYIGAWIWHWPKGVKIGL